MQLSAYFERIAYVNNGFSIVLFSTNDESASSVAQSKLTSHKSKYVFSAYLNGFDVKTLIKNISYNLEGSWNKNSRGFYYKVNNIAEMVGDNEDEIITYLCSFDGIGIKTAEKIYKRFKEQTIDIVENFPDELRKAKVRKKAIENIKSCVKEKGKKREVIQFLSQFSLSTRKINNILNNYDLYKIIDIIKANPFHLSEGGTIDFISANSIAIDLNIALTSKERIRQAIIFIINNKFRNDGDLIINVNKLINVTNKSLNNNCEKKINYEKLIRYIIDEFINQGTLIYLSPDNKEYLYLYRDYGAEKYAANKIIDMAHCPDNRFSIPECDVLPLLELSEQKNHITLSETQRKAVISTMGANISVITGGPGTGKSTLLKIILDIFKAKFGNNIGLCAPTGKAARRMAECTGIQHACTIHSMLGIEEDHCWSIGATNTCQISYDLIVVDEISMLDMDLMYLLIQSIPYSSKVVFLGDSDQLPSVGPGAVLKEIVDSKTISVTVLDKIYRQSEQSTIIMNSYKLNNNMLDFVFDENFVFIEKESPDVAQTIADIYIQELKNGVNQDDIQILTPFRNSKYIASVPEINSIIQNAINPANGLNREIKINNVIFRKYDRVIQQKNTEEVKNGDIGTILDIKLNQGIVFVIIDFGYDRIVEYSREDMEENHLDLAYSITAHKSQGSEYRTIIMPIIDEHKYMLRRKLIYTAWTRAKQKVILVGSHDTLITAASNITERQRFTAFGQRLKMREFRYSKKKKG